MAAALAVMNIYEQEPVVETMFRQGKRLRDGLNQAIDELGLQEYFQVIGQPCNLIYVTRDQQKERSQPFRTLFMQEMIRRGILGPSLVVSRVHDDAAIDQTIEALAAALVIYQQALSDGVEKYLIGRPVKPVFRRYN